MSISVKSPEILRLLKVHCPRVGLITKGAILLSKEARFLCLKNTKHGIPNKNNYKYAPLYDACAKLAIKLVAKLGH